MSSVHADCACSIVNVAQIEEHSYVSKRKSGLELGYVFAMSLVMSQKPKTKINDIALSVLLSVVLGALIAAGLIWIMVEPIPAPTPPWR